MYILGISAFYHDSAACLLKDGAIVAAAQEERFTRKKHDHAFPGNAVRFCLDFEKIDIAKIDYIAFYDKPLLKFERILETHLAYVPKGIKSFIKALPLWLKKKLWIRELIKNELEYEGEVLFPEHHLSHAASAFYPSPFEEAAFITMDGVGEWATASYGIGEENNVSIIADINFPHSLGLLYSAFTYYTGFRVNSGEYKVMGLAPYGEPKYKDLIYEYLIDAKDDGSFKMNMKYFDYSVGLKMTSKKFDKLFGGPPRKPESELTQKEMDLARSVQEVTEEIVLKMAQNVRAKTGKRNLCLAGGVALNCVANGKLLRSKIFDDIWIQPAAGDAGGAVGSALAVWHLHLKQPRNVNPDDSMSGCYLGPEFDGSYIESFLKSSDCKYVQLDTESMINKIADLINDEKIIGWFDGRMEFGPRALGARSIIGDARSPKMQKTMNLKIKYRESFRPFAPSVLAEEISNYFDIDRESPYMLLVANVKENRQIEMSKEQSDYFGLDKLNVVRSDIPAITHVDYSARIQSVNGKYNPNYHKLISKFNEKHGSAVIVNTSFNVRGEPIVCTPEDAYRCFMRTEMDYLVLGNFLLDKRDQKKLEGDSNWREEFQLD